nr:dehydrogenase/reductase SDR family protein 7-like [Cherax quadricarinatus]
MCKMKNISSHTEWVASLGRAIKHTRNLAVWSSIPWFIGWATLTVMGPIVAVRLVYRVLQVVMYRAFSGEKALCGKIFQPPELHVPTIVKLDLENINSIPGMVDNLLKTHGHIDVLINNAGISFRGAAIDTDISVDIKLMVVNYFGQVALTKAILPSMVERKSGHLVAVSSVQGKLAIPYRSCYTASKHALQGFFDSLRAEVADSGVLVTVVSPGYISTNLSLNAVTGDGSLYGTMDATTASGMSPEKVAEHIVGSLINGYEELVLAPLSHRLAIILHTLAPSLISRIMKSRALSQKYMYAHKED